MSECESCKELKEALEFYGATSHYKELFVDADGHGMHSAVAADGGELARQAVGKGKKKGGPAIGRTHACNTCHWHTDIPAEDHPDPYPCETCKPQLEHGTEWISPQALTPHVGRHRDERKDS